MNSLFRQRFQGHELPVDPAVWQGIQQHLARTAPTPDEDGVSKLFKERFQDHEAMVDPAIWANISGQLGHSVVAGTSAATGWLGWAAAGVVAIAIGTVALVNSEGPDPADLVQRDLTEVPAVQEAPAVGPASVQQVPEPAEKTLPVSPSVVVAEKPRREAAVPPIAPSERSEVAPERVEVPTNTASGDEVPGEEVGEVSSTSEGVAIVESIIQDLTTEVKQEVLTQPQDNKDGSALPVSDPTEEPFAVPDPSPAPKLFMPNTFTPNGDGVNDEYEVGGLGAYEQVMVRVTSLKTGQIVFRGNGSEPWRGDGCEDGMYLVALEARTSDGRSATEGKVVWLNRNPLN